MDQFTIDTNLASDIKQLIQSAKQNAAVAVNAQLTSLYWQVGTRLSQALLKGERADYGKQVVAQLAKSLTGQFGKGWSTQQLRHCIKFAEVFTDEQIVSAARRQLSWTHFKAIIYLDDPLKREFYSTMAMQEHWSTRTLNERIDSQLFERTALSKKPEETIIHDLNQLREQGKINEDLLLKDPYILDFLELNDVYIEKDLEDAILREMQQFLMEMGSGFSFIARQFRVLVDDDDYYIDLLFYNRKLKRLIAIDLKVGRFKPEYKGQMELYLRWLAKFEQESDENPPLGIILCTGKKQEQIELLELDKSGIHVAEYLTTLPPKALLEAHLRLATERAKQRIGNKT
ncbi:MAG: putative nuclease of restriction endonuclease-like (RecB) superfamily [Phenylobacterium sp.]|jgi:predicted nuclease of restriction endonuclease-like (RecB) superfamily